MIKQAIIPLAGLGTRLLPLTSVFAKELLPINGKPGIQYILDECIEAGIKEVVFIISKKIDKLIFSIIIGGAIGNVSDRVIYNAVPDFIDLHYMNFHWFTFNVADIFISIGVIIFVTKGLFIK